MYFPQRTMPGHMGGSTGQSLHSLSHFASQTTSLILGFISARSRSTLWIHGSRGLKDSPIKRSSMCGTTELPQWVTINGMKDTSLWKTVWVKFYGNNHALFQVSKSITFKICGPQDKALRHENLILAPLLNDFCSPVSHLTFLDSACLIK